MRARDLLTCTAFAVAIFVAVQHWPGGNVVSGRARVIDGDTIHIGNHKIRLFGIDAPESAQTCGAVACGQMATAFLTELIAGLPVSCRRVDTDKYKRMVATCLSSRAFDLSEEMVRGGWAMEMKYFSQGVYSRAEREARAAGSGVWSLPFRSPSDYRRSRAQ